MSYPAALPADVESKLPAVTEDRGIIILALPRINTLDYALDKFLADNANRSIELLFVYGLDGGAEFAEAAEICAGFYSRRYGVRAQAAGVR